jgi:4-hydroxy-tetrahydrodipicolinate reductase
MIAAPVRVGVFGGGGRMGRAVVEAVEADPALTLAALVGRQTPSDVHFGDCDVVIDFSVAGATPNLVARLGPGHAALVSGVTGRTPAQEALLEDRAAVAPVLIAANFSIGVAVLRRLVREAVSALGAGWDVEVLDLHHKRKADAPSGTALLLGQEAARARGLPWPESLQNARQGLTGPRADDEIGVAALRGGDVVGEHTVFLLGEAERLELVHRAGDRRIFALGAVRAARWLAGRAPGRYALDDVLGP